MLNIKTQMKKARREKSNTKQLKFIYLRYKVSYTNFVSI